MPQLFTTKFNKRKPLLSAEIVIIVKYVSGILNLYKYFNYILEKKSFIKLCKKITLLANWIYNMLKVTYVYFKDL